MNRSLMALAGCALSLAILAGCSSVHSSDSTADANSGSVTGKISPGNKPRPAKPVTTTTTTTTTTTPPPVTTGTPVQKSISGWATCDGVTDDNANVARALAAAKNSAFTLIVDCPVRIDYGTNGMDIDRTLFIDNGTTVQFTGAGKFLIDNVMIPAFVIANSSNITLADWNVEYDGGMPINGDVGGYVKDGKFFAAGGSVQPAGAFNNFIITPWLAKNRGITFNSATSLWRGGMLPIATIMFSGDTYNVNVTGMHLYAPPTAGADKYIPLAFSLAPNYKSNQTVDQQTPHTSEYLAEPHLINFTNIVLDGTLFGWLGQSQNVTWNNIVSHRYSDLQDANGGNVGGINKWFAPPHLFYLNYDTTMDAKMFNSGLSIKNVVDDGPRVGVARDKGGSDTVSGYALSLKIGCNDCSVDTYSSSRPDGLLDVLASDGLTISNVTATYDSSFINNLFPGWRFPTAPYKNVTFENVVFTDVANSSVRAPIGNAVNDANENIVFSNVRVGMKHWASGGLPLPNIPGTGSNVVLDYSISDNLSRLRGMQQGSAMVTLQATPSSLKAGDSTILVWTSQEASSCTASGAWSGSLGTAGSRAVKFSSSGSYSYTLSCQSGDVLSETTMTVLVN